MARRRGGSKQRRIQKRVNSVDQRCIFMNESLFSHAVREKRGVDYLAAGQRACRADESLRSIEIAPNRLEHAPIEKV
jgi:hypothetical protein